MCGICGIWTDKRDDSSRQDVQRMIRRISHRGTEQGSFADRGVALGSRRLPIQDIPGTPQPLFNEDRSLVLVGQGEIYNHLALRRELEEKGHHFSTDCDLECILHLYEDLGEAFPGRLKGQFAIALWDAGEQSLLLARDRMGICPLFYSFWGGRFAFASDLNAIRELAWFDDAVDVGSLSHYLSLCYVPGPRTIYCGARSVRPGHVLILRQGALREEAFWNPFPGGKDLTPGQIREELSLLLRDAVTRRMDCGVDWGILLSGGLDSSCILALAATGNDRPIKCFNMGYEEATFDESDQAAKIAARFGADLRAVHFNPADLLSNVDGFLTAMDQPLADESCFPLYMLNREAAKSVRVVISGEGSDELLGGYETYQAYLAARWYARAPESLKRLVKAATGWLPLSDARIGIPYRIKAFVTGSGKSTAAAHLWYRIALDEAEKRALLNPESMGGGLEASSEALFESAFSKSPFASDLGRLMHLDRILSLPDTLLAKADRMGLASTIESRFPFLDDDLVDFVSGLPSELHVRGILPWQSKSLLRKAAGGLLPASLRKTAKRGFNMPIAACLRGPWSPLLDEYLGESALRDVPFFEPAAVTDLVSRFRARGEVRVRALWVLLIFLMWYKNR